MSIDAFSQLGECGRYLYPSPSTPLSSLPPPTPLLPLPPFPTLFLQYHHTGYRPRWQGTDRDPHGPEYSLKPLVAPGYVGHGIWIGPAVLGPIPYYEDVELWWLVG